MWLASRGVYANPDDDYANFGPGIVNDDGGMTIAGIGNNTFNSNGDENDNSDNASVRPVASIHCGYATNGCIRDNIETNYVLSYLFKCDKQKIDKYGC